jgi:hypothetical protein
MEEKKDEAVVENEDAALDKELAETLDTIKAGKALPPKVVVEPETKAEEKPAEAKVEEPSTPPTDKLDEFRIPNKGKFESDESYEKRIELLDLVKRKKAAKTDEQRQAISDQIKTTKSQMKTLNGSDKITNPLQNTVKTEEKPEEDEALKADKERLKQLGGATKEDIEQILKTERFQSEVKSTLDKFVDRHPELKDEDTREVFFDFVDSNYNYQNKSGKELMTVLELARENMFKPSETIQERVLKGANVQEKVNAMQFPGGTISKAAYSPEMRKSIDELTATGMSEDKALELLSD